MSFQEVFKQNRRVLSFELYPPKTEKGEQALYKHVEALNQFEPDFITCTYGAGGSTREKTLEIVSQIKQRFGSVVASHLTLVGSTRDQLCDYLEQADQMNIDAIVALRGDPPQGTSQFEATAGGFANANQLVDLIHQEFPRFGVAVAGYPEVHREAASAESDLAFLKTKVDAGAHVVITQLFYDNADFFRFRDRCHQQGINVPILPGLLPVTKLEQVQRITALCGSRLPDDLVDKLSQNDDPEWQFRVGVEHAVAQIDELVQQGADGIHFYVLNRSQAVVAIMSALKGEFQLM